MAQATLENVSALYIFVHRPTKVRIGGQSDVQTFHDSVCLLSDKDLF